MTSSRNIYQIYSARDRLICRHDANAVPGQQEVCRMVHDGSQDEKPKDGSSIPGLYPEQEKLNDKSPKGGRSAGIADGNDLDINGRIAEIDGDRFG